MTESLTRQEVAVISQIGVGVFTNTCTANHISTINCWQQEMNILVELCISSLLIFQMLTEYEDVCKMDIHTRLFHYAYQSAQTHRLFRVALLPRNCFSDTIIKTQYSMQKM